MSTELEVNVEDIMDFDLSLFDTTPANIIGLHKEFISSPRLDNMCSSIVATHSILERAQNVTKDATIETIILYDHEEIGSVSAQGAAGTFTNDLLRRTFGKFTKDPSNFEEDYDIAVRKSLYVSADMAHA